MSLSGLRRTLHPVSQNWSRKIRATFDNLGQIDADNASLGSLMERLERSNLVVWLACISVLFRSPTVVP